MTSLGSGKLSVSLSACRFLLPLLGYWFSGFSYIPGTGRRELGRNSIKASRPVGGCCPAGWLEWVEWVGLAGVGGVGGPGWSGWAGPPQRALGALPSTTYTYWNTPWERTFLKSVQ